LYRGSVLWVSHLLPDCFTKFSQVRKHCLFLGSNSIKKIGLFRVSRNTKMHKKILSHCLSSIQICTKAFEICCRCHETRPIPGLFFCYFRKYSKYWIIFVQWFRTFVLWLFFLLFLEIFAKYGSTDLFLDQIWIRKYTSFVFCETQKCVNKILLHCLSCHLTPFPDPIVNFKLLQNIYISLGGFNLYKNLNYSRNHFVSSWYKRAFHMVHWN